jgi:hypothetical protein
MRLTLLTSTFQFSEDSQVRIRAVYGGDAKRKLVLEIQ